MIRNEFTYQLSCYRSELMGCAMLAVMLFHAWDLDLGNETLYNLCRLGFGGVDLFITLSAMGICMSLARLRKPLRVIGENSLEIYLINASLFLEKESLIKLYPFGPTNRLYYLAAFTVNILLGIGLHRFIERGRARLKQHSSR